MLRLAFQLGSSLSGKLVFRLTAWQGASWDDMESKSQRSRVSFTVEQAVEHFCVSHALLSASCVHQTVMTVTAPDQSSGSQ